MCAETLKSVLSFLCDWSRCILHPNWHHGAAELKYCASGNGKELKLLQHDLCTMHIIFVVHGSFKSRKRFLPKSYSYHSRGHRRMNGNRKKCSETEKRAVHYMERIRFNAPGAREKKKCLVKCSCGCVDIRCIRLLVAQAQCTLCESDRRPR